MVAQVTPHLPPSPATALSPPVSLDVVAALLSGLNRDQRRAVTHGNGPQLVIAGPGTGKTEVVTRRVAWLIATRRARPSQILALTFTDNAATEMQARVDLLVPYGQADAEIHTFHAFGDRLLRENAFELGLSGDVRLITRAEAVVLLRDHLFELGLERYRPLGDPTRFLGALADLFGRAKDEGIDPQRMAGYAARLAATAADDPGRDAADALVEQSTAYGRYQILLAERGLIDHGDQLALPLRLLRERPSVRGDVLTRYRYLLVDEFQDMNRAQLELVLALTGSDRNVTVVGDPDQAIYTFRGAASDNMRRFATAHPDLRRVVLRRNYRSRRPIVEAARRLICHGPRDAGPGFDEGQLATRRARQPTPVRLLALATPEAEADAVAAEVAARIDKGESPGDFALLARSNAEIDPLIRSLTIRGVPVRTRSPQDFFAHRHVRPLLGLLRFVADTSLTLELYVLATAWPYQLGGEALTEVLARSRREHRSAWQVVCDMADDGRDRILFADRLQRLVADLRAAIEISHQRSSGELLYDHLRRTGHLARLAGQADPSEAQAVARFFDIVRSRAALLDDARAASLVPHLDAVIEAEDEAPDTGPLDDDGVTVLTAHRAKGLEFRVVYLTGLSDGRFPARGRPATLSMAWHELHDEPAETEEDRLQEERRLCYVAMTRARDELWLSTHATGVGGRGRRRPSPFIAEALDLPVQIELRPVDTLSTLSAPPAAEPSAKSREAPVASVAFSFSQLEDYLGCPERYRLRHVVGLPTPAHHALSYGRAMHAAVASFHLRAARGEPPEDALLADFQRAWSPEGFLSRDHEEARFAAGQRALKRFREQQLAEPPRVVAVERPFEFGLGDVRVRGRIDRIDRDPEGSVIVDYKSSDVRDQRRANDRARDSLQLQIYALALERESGSLPARMKLHFLDSGVVGATTPERGRLERAQQKARDAAAGIAASAFEATPSPIVCGYCPFRQICPSSAA
jgi:DNA helicase-2/ATP-dependent DNA helicase PcrA